MLIPQPSKDLQYCEMIRPISLINTDLKILPKILATRINSIISSLVKSDQTGFIPVRSTHINLQRLFAT